MLQNLRELYRYRALLWALTVRELSARYRASVLGFLWTFLNPTLQMLVYTLLFSVYMRQNIEHYAYFLFVGLLPWGWFSSSITGCATSISDRRDLLTKVRFPAQVLPATVILTNLINYLLSIPLVLALGAFFGVWPSWHLVALPAVLFVQLLFTVALGYLVSALNVRFRDLQFVVANLTMLWFFLTPILYPIETIPAAYRPLLHYGNPVAMLVNAYQAIFVRHAPPDFAELGCLALGAAALLWLTTLVFEAGREEFAEYV